MVKLRYFWNELNSTFWFIPTLLLLLSVASAVGFLHIDVALAFEPKGDWRYLFPGSVNSARSILSTIASATIGIAGTVFSITLVVLTLATNQLGARLLQNFMYDRLNQVVLGTYVATYVYCLIVLNAIKQEEGEEFLPVISILVALVVSIFGIVLLVVFIHHVSVSIQPNKVVADIASMMLKNMKNLYPSDIGEEKPGLEAAFNANHYAYHLNVKASDSGYLKSVDGKTLISLATEENLVIALQQRPGAYMVSGELICKLYAKGPIDEALAGQVGNFFIAGKVRSSFQDAEFSIEQMVEVAGRALSPGINDPYTAIACIDNLTSVMCFLTSVKFPSAHRHDDAGDLRVVAESLDFQGMMQAAFSQIRQYGESNPSVIIRMMESMATIKKFVTNDEQRKATQTHADMLLRCGERSFKEPADLEDLQKRYFELK